MQVEEHLTAIQSTMDRGQRQAPARDLMDLIDQMGRTELNVWRPDIERVIGQFHKKLRNQLTESLNERLSGRASAEQADAESHKIVDAPAPEPTQFVPIDPTLLADFQAELAVLQERHIFQWSTFYRDCFDDFFNRVLDDMVVDPAQDSTSPIAELLAAHTQAVFSQGYEFQSSQHGHDHAVRKSLSGLTRFLELQLDFYTARSSSTDDYRSAAGLRSLFSAAVCGILEGYAALQFGGQSGREILPRFQRQWMHYVAFLKPEHAQRIVASIESGPLQQSLQTSVLPMLRGLDTFFRNDTRDFWPMPVLGQYSWNQRRLDISFRPPRNAAVQRLIQISTFLDESFVRIEDLEEALGRQAVLLLAPLKPDVQRVVSERERLKSIVVAVERIGGGEERDTHASLEATANKVYRILDEAFYQLRSKLRANAPITYNFAREFPLHHPEQASFFHVTRSSVRDLLRTFERRNGVRLWCSIRRSGKTMACMDMGTTTAESRIIPQTCGVPTNNAAELDARIFYDQLRSAIDSGRMVPRTFIADCVSQCAQTDINDKRIVLVIDEYETLFGLLESAVGENTAVRYRAVQPILDQLVEFSRQNLLVFLGQQPDAHFIMMDQNQLAPYVTQDAFPLFEHVQGAAAGEFAALVDKILSRRIECSAGFLDLLHNETAGHPYLTANVLVEFVEWLIEEKRPQRDLTVRDGDFHAFSRARLTPNRMLLSGEYEFFRSAAEAALSRQCLDQIPWLYFVYWMVRLLAKENTAELRVTLDEYKHLVERIPTPDGAPRMDRSEILRTASHSNFLAYDEHHVSVKVRTLGRVAAAVQPALA